MDSIVIKAAFNHRTYFWFDNLRSTRFLPATATTATRLCALVRDGTTVHARLRTRSDGLSLEPI